MGVSSDTYASSIFAANTPEAISQIKKQRTCQIPEEKNGMVDWKHGKLEELISECEAIKKRLKRSVKTKKQPDQKAFCRLMLQGQVKKAFKIVNHASGIDGKHDITTDIKKKLKEKHPKAAELKQSAITDEPETKTQRVIFENITQDDITSTTKNSLGSGGPTQIDMDTWREMICSKSYGTHSKMLADEITTLAKHLAADTIPHDYISTLLTCRLVPLKKKDYSIRLASRCW